MLRTTHTYVELELSPAAYGEIRKKLMDADYGHCLMADGAIDMSGIGVTTAKGLETLTDGERAIVKLVAEGKQNKVIAVELGYTHNTVNVYVSRILKKVGCANRRKLAIAARYLFFS